jgi:hypothetical protein
MSAPFRIKYPGTRTRLVSRSSSEDFKNYLERLTKMIPSEVIGLYLAGSGSIPMEEKVALALWTLVCLIGVFCIRVWGTSDPKPQNNLSPLPPEWPAVGISCVAFIIWVYAMGGPFASFGVHIPYVGTLLVLAWTFFVPIFYKDRS